MNFFKYQHIERFGTEEVEEIELGNCYCFSKLDGANGQVFLDNNKQVKAGSRNRELTLEKDNQGFYAHILQQENIKNFLLNYPNYKLVGEWLVPHSLKTYRDDAWRKFYVFDIVEEMEEGDFRYLTYDEYKPLLDEYKIGYIPCLKIIKNGSYDDFIKILESNNYLIQNGKGIGEGIVLKNYSFVNKWQRTTWAKIVTSEFREKHLKGMGTSKIECKLLENEIVESYITQAFIEKTYAKIALDGWSSKKIPQLLSTVYHEFVIEEIWEILKKHKNPTIDFKKLQQLTYNKVKEIKPEIF